MKELFYIDESGNTGTDWLNNEQPYFTYGGWLIRDDKKSEVESYLSDILRECQGLELKSRNFFKRPSGFTRFKNIFDKLVVDYAALPIFIIADKKFMIAAKIVETFFDCEYNPAVNGYLTYPGELKRALASCISRDEKVIGKFASLISGCTVPVEVMIEIKHQLIVLFESQKHQTVADSLRNLTQHNLKEMPGEFNFATHNGATKCRLTLTIPMLVEILKNIELRSNLIELPVQVYHDSLRGYDMLFQEIKSIFFKDEIPIITGAEERYFLTKFPHIKSIDMVNSKKEIMIQAADLLCGFVSKTIAMMQIGKSIDSSIIDVYSHLIDLHDEYSGIHIQIWNYYASYEFEAKFYKALNSSSNFAERDFHSIINQKFIQAVK